MASPTQFDTNLSEFTYTVAREAPISLRRLLPEKLFRAISTERGAMKFASKSTLEQKREFFSCLGIETFLIFADMKREAVNDFRFLFKDFDLQSSHQSTLKKLGEDNVYISSNKDFCFLLGHLSQVIDTEGYARQMELIRSSYHLQNFSKKLNGREHKENVESNKGAEYLGKIFHGVLWATDTVQEITGLDLDTFRVLLYFYNNRHAYISVDTLISTFAGGIHARTVGKCRVKLSNGLLVQKYPSRQKNEYTITGKGIIVVNQFRDKVIKSLDF